MWPLKTFLIKMENKKYHTVEVIAKSNINIVKTDTIETIKIQIHDRLPSRPGTCTQAKSGGVKPAIEAHISPLINMKYTGRGN